MKQNVQASVPRDRAVKVKSPELEPTVSEEGARRVYTWTRSNLERKITPKADPAQLAIRGRLPAPDIQLSSFQSWEEVGRWYDGLQRAPIVPTKDVREKAAELTQDAADNAAKLRAIYKYVSTEFRYIGVAFGIGRYQPHSASEVLSNHYGDCKDKHTLMASLLAAAGIAAYPALINSSRVLDLDVPSPAQFDHVITVVPQGKEIIWLDTTTEIAPFGYLVLQLRDKRALVMFPDKPSVFEATPLDPPFPESWIFKINAKLDDLGTLEGKVEQTIRGDTEVRMRAALRRLPRTQWNDLIQQISYATGFAGEVSDVSVSMPELTETPIRVSYVYKRKDYPDWKQHRIVPPAPNVLWLPSEEHGKLPSSLWLGSPGEFQFESRVELPKGYTPDLPKKMDLKQEFIEYHSFYALEGNVLVAHYRVLLKGREVSSAAVNDYKAFAEKVHEDRDQFIPLSSGKLESAQQAVAKMQNQIGGLPERLVALGDALFNKGDLDGAIAEYREALRLNPEDFLAHVRLGGTLLKMKRYGEATAELEAAMEKGPKDPKDPKNTAVALLMGQAYIRSGEADKGMAAFRRALAGDSNTVTLSVVAHYLAEHNLRLDEALGYAQQAVQEAEDEHPGSIYRP